MKLKVLASHPIQYQAPLFRQLLADGCGLEVGYYHPGTARKAGLDVDFGIEIAWDIDLLSGYPHRFFCSQLASFSLSEQLKVLPSLVGWMLKERHTPLLLMGWFAEVMWAVWLLAIVARVPVLILCENTPESFAAFPKPAWRVTLLRWLLKHTDAGVYIGSHNKNFLIYMGMQEERLFAAPYSIDNQRFAAEWERLMPHRAACCQQYGLDADLPTFVFCGKLIPKKRPLQLLEAYCLAGLHEQAQLIYVGEGRQRVEIEAYCQKYGLRHVHLLGFFNQSQMPLAYVLGEVLCLISDSTETWGLVVNEALACKRPVIVSDSVGCQPDLVNPNTGWVVPSGDLDGLAQTLQLAYRNRSYWPHMGGAGYELVAQHTFANMSVGIRHAVKRATQ